MEHLAPKLKMFLEFTAAAIVIILAGYLMHSYEENAAAIAEKINILEEQNQELSLALQSSNSLSQETKREIEQISKKQQEQSKRTAAAPASTASNSTENTITAVVAKASPAVVSIEQKVGVGSGFIIRQDGYILTNKHVVDNPDADYTVVLASGDKKAAKAVFRDEASDIALLKIEGTGYPTLPLGDSSTLKAGQTVAAIGNALGQYDNSVSVGIISGLNRTIEAENVYGNTERLTGIIQTDTAINRGNSGGPLLDLSGRVIGMNVAMEQGANNIAFAIPINSIKAIVNSLLR